ncbi:MAG: polyprenyl synthetase family protein [Gemmatimonadota bacterium]
MIATGPIEEALTRAADRIREGTRVADAMRYALAGGGKRLRPALVVACYEAVSRRTADDRVADLACAIELIHTYSLVHDDLPSMDDDDVRRGRPTTHRVYGEDTAMLAGVALIPLAFSIADEAARSLDLSEAQRSRIARTLAHAAGAAGMVGGQVMDVDTGGNDVELETLEQIHGAKTGALLRAACCLGAIAAGANDAQLAAIDTYGRHLGLAFQITDDVLDETGSTEVLGKTAGKDRSAAKATFPNVLGLGGAVERAATEALAAVEALRDADLAADALARLSRFAVERKR